MDEKIKEKIDNYKRLSNLYFNAIIALSGGVGGLFLVNLTVKTGFLLLVACILDIMCILRHQYCNEAINGLIERV